MTNPTAAVNPAYLGEIRTRRVVGFLVIGLLLSLDLVATGAFGGSERTLAVVRSIILPGLPFLEWLPWLGAVTIILLLTAVGAWLRWGTDWIVLLIGSASIMVTWLIMPLHHAAAVQTHHVVEASHEFTIVLVVFTMLARLRLLIARLPGADWITSRLPKGFSFPAVDTARTAGLTLLAAPDSADARSSLADRRLMRRAGKVNRWARFRFDPDVLQSAHAPLRAARVLAGQADAKEMQRWVEESRARLAGVTDSEPTWVRLLDGMLAALSLQRLGESVCVDRWRHMLDTRFALRHGRRPGALHTPSMMSLGTASNWEHAAATALAHRSGWIGSEDWRYLRPRCLGAAAGAAVDPATLRLIAAGRIWAGLTGDEEAQTILGRRTITGDTLASALDQLAQSNQ